MQSNTDDTSKQTQKETGRLEAFSDGVFAVAITLLILTFPIPHFDSAPSQALMPQLETMLGKQWQSYVAYIISFVTILIMWVNHHAIFKLVQRADHTFIIINGLLLMMITFVNYSTGVLANFIHTPDERLASAFYSGTLFVIALLYNLLWNYAARKRRLILGTVPQTVVDTITAQYRYGPLLYLLAFVLAFFNAYASAAANAALAVYFAFTGSD